MSHFIYRCELLQLYLTSDEDLLSSETKGEQNGILRLWKEKAYLMNMYRILDDFVRILYLE